MVHGKVRSSESIDREQIELRGKDKQTNSKMEVTIHAQRVTGNRLSWG